MLVIRNLNLISVQSWTCLKYMNLEEIDDKNELDEEL